MFSVFIILFASIESGYFDSGFIQKWADEVISRVAAPKYWLLELSSSSTSQESLGILRQQLRERGLMLDVGYGELLVGFAYLRYLSQESSLEELETQLIDIVDAYDVSGIDPEFIQAMFIKAKENDKSSIILSENLGGFGKSSGECAKYLTSYDCLEEEESAFLDD